MLCPASNRRFVPSTDIRRGSKDRDRLRQGEQKHRRIAKNACDAIKPVTADTRDVIIPASSEPLTLHGTRLKQSEPENGDDAQSRTGQERCRWAIGVPQHACED